MTNPFKRIPWRKVGTAALTIGSSLVPGGSAIGTAIEVFKEVRKADEPPVAGRVLTGPEKKADVLAHIGAVAPEVGLAVGQLIDAYVAIRKAWASLKVAVAAVKAQARA
jgi:hypothetical protein